MGKRGLNGKAALITGASRRIGREIAYALSEEGVSIIIHYSGKDDEPDAKVACAALEQSGVKAWSVRADFADPEECEALIERAMEKSGTLDILVNNASLFRADTIENAGLGQLEMHMRVNAWAPFVLSREFARRAGHGKIVNILDTRVSGYDWSHFSYMLSKKALLSLTEMTALMFAPRITVNAVAPGLILPPPGKDMAYLESLARTVPLKRHGGPRDVADAVVYLLKSEYVTGQVIYVDGGRHLMEYDHGPHPD